MKSKQLASTDERHLQNFTFSKYQQINGWLSCKYLKLTKAHMHINLSFSPKFLSILRTLKSESRFSTLQLLWNRIKTRLESEEICIIGCLMLWRRFQRLVHRNSKRPSYYILSMTQNKHLIV